MNPCLTSQGRTCTLFPSNKRNGRSGKDRPLIADAGISYVGHRDSTRPYSSPPVSRFSTLPADQLAVFWRFPLRAEKRIYGLDPKMHAEVRCSGHLRAASSHLSCQGVEFLSSSGPRGLMREKRCPDCALTVNF